MAVTLTAADLPEATGIGPDPRWDRIWAAAKTAVDDYAPDAPDALADEALVRFAAYLQQSDYGTMRSEGAGPLAQEYVVNHGPMFRNCGAASLLSRYRKRRAAPIGGG